MTAEQSGANAVTPSVAGVERMGQQPPDSWDSLVVSITCENSQEGKCPSGGSS